MLNKAILMGRLVADPELRQTPNGISVVTFRIAVDRNYSKDKERQADFIDIVAWRNSAEFVSKYFSKGKMIIVDGSIQTRSYEDKNGNKRTAVEVVAENVMFGESKGSSSGGGQSYGAPSPSFSENHGGAPVSYASGDVGDFEAIPSDSEDLPF